MSALPRIRSWWNAIAHRDDIQQQVEAELEFHIEAQAEELMRRGVPEADALRRARAEAGRPDTQSEKYRNAIGLRIFDELAGDLRYGLPGCCVIRDSRLSPFCRWQLESALRPPCSA